MFIINANEGQNIRVGDRTLTVLSLIAPGVVRIAVDGEDETILLGYDRKTELFPEVSVSIERNLGLSPRIKFLFEAPRSVVIREQPHEAAP